MDCRKCEEKKREKDYGNGISEIGKQISAIPLTKMWEKKKERIGEKNFPYLDYGNSIAENVKKKGKKGEMDYSNGIAEIGKKNFPCFGNTIAVKVNKNKKREKDYGNGIAVIGGNIYFGNSVAVNVNK